MTVARAEFVSDPWAGWSDYSHNVAYNRYDG